MSSRFKISYRLSASGLSSFAKMIASGDMVREKWAEAAYQARSRDRETASHRFRQSSRMHNRGISLEALLCVRVKLHPNMTRILFAPLRNHRPAHAAAVPAGFCFSSAGDAQG